MASLAMIGAIGLAGVNIVLAGLLLALYGRVYAKTKAPFTVGLLLFALAFLLDNGLVVYSYGTMMNLVPDALAPYLLVVGLLEASGLGAVLWTASR
jgi:hypothetical protein